TEGEIWEREAPEADHADEAVVPIIATPGRVNAGRYGEHNHNQQRGQRELQGVGIALAQESADTLVVAQRDPEIALQHALPIIQILLAEWEIESIGMPCGLQVRRRGAFSQHLLDGIARDEMDQEKYERHYQPDHWQRVEDAG